MGWLTAIVIDTAGPTATETDTARRGRFLAAARPALDRGYRLAGLILGDAAEAEDAVQDALVTAWHRFDDLCEPARFDAWLDRIVVNGCRDRLRRRAKVRFVALDGAAEPPARDPFAAFLERDALLGSISSLSADERMVVILRFWADLPLDEVGRRLDWPLGTVKSRLHRALDRLRIALERDPRDATE